MYTQYCDKLTRASPWAWTDIGEKVRQKHDASMEESRQQAIRCTEDVVRREEAQKREEALSLAAERWKHERQELFKDAHQSQLRAVARQNEILEKNLREEFSESVVKLQEENRHHLAAVVEETWTEAAEVTRKAVTEARREEQERAQEEARKVAERVTKEKMQDAELASGNKARALDEQRLAMEALKAEALSDQQRELEQRFEQRLEDVRRAHEGQMAALQSQYDEQVATSERLSSELQTVMDDRDEWVQKCENLKKEFSDFIDQFPGFRGDFLLK